MTGETLRRLGRIALEDRPGPRLLETLLEGLTADCGARGGALLRDGAPVTGQADLPREAGGIEVELLPGPHRWLLRLDGGTRPSDEILVATRLALRLWELREALRASRLGERLRLWELEAIRTLASSIAGILDPETLGEEMTTSLVMLMGVRRAELLVGEGPGSARRVALFGDPPSASIDLDDAWRNGLTGERLLARPLSISSEVLGLVLVADKEARTGGQPFSKDDARLLELFAVQAAVALENARLYRASLEKERLDRELAVAAEVQSYLQPPAFPEMAGYRISTYRRPARFVAGDCFTVSRRTGGLEALLADVSGKGVGAGLLAASLQSGARLLADLDEPLPATAQRLGQTLHETTEPHQFATAILVRCEEDGRVVLVNAGHPPAFVLRTGGTIERIGSTGLPLGLLPGSEYTAAATRLEPGDAIVLYTDGLTEAENGSGEELGVERLAGIVRSAARTDREALCTTVVAAVERFAEGRPFADDITVMVIERSRARGTG